MEANWQWHHLPCQKGKDPGCCPRKGQAGSPAHLLSRQQGQLPRQLKQLQLPAIAGWVEVGPSRKKPRKGNLLAKRSSQRKRKLLDKRSSKRKRKLLAQRSSQRKRKPLAQRSSQRKRKLLAKRSRQRRRKLLAKRSKKRKVLLDKRGRRKVSLLKVPKMGSQRNLALQRRNRQRKMSKAKA